MEMENMIEDAELVVEEKAKEEVEAVKEEAFEPMDLAMTDEGKASTGLVRKMNDMFKLQVDNLKKSVDKLNEEEIPVKEKDLDDAVATVLNTPTICEVLQFKDTMTKDVKIQEILNIKPEVLSKLSTEEQEIVNKAKNAYISLKSTQNVIHHYSKTMSEMDMMCIRKDNIIAMVQLLPFMVNEIIDNKRTESYLDRCLHLTSEELTTEKIKAVAEATRNLLRTHITFLRKDLSKLMPMGGVEDATKSALDVIPRIAKISVEQLPEEMHHHKYTFEAGMNVALLLILNRKEYAFEKDCSIRLTPSVKYEAKLLQIVDALGIPSLEAFRNILILELADIIEATKDKVPLFKALVDYMQDKLNWIKDNKPELYEKKIAAADKFADSVKKLHEDADKDITEDQVNAIKEEIDQSVKAVQEKMGINTPVEKDVITDAEIVEETKEEQPLEDHKAE